MSESTDPTLLVLCGKRPPCEVVDALSSACEALGHAAGFAVCTLAAPGGKGTRKPAGDAGGERDDGRETGRADAGAGTHGAVHADADSLALLVERTDPWSVVAIDEASVSALAAAFGKESASLAPDAPVCAEGYTLVAVPGFAECLHDAQAKRVAWRRLKAARHPGNPLG
jgi:hypothetical protein